MMDEEDRCLFILTGVIAIVAAIILVLAVGALFTFLMMYMLTAFSVPHEVAVWLTIGSGVMAVVGTFVLVGCAWRRYVREEVLE